VPEDADPAAEIEKVIEEVQSISDDLDAVAGQFILHYAKNTEGKRVLLTDQMRRAIPRAVEIGSDK
jgi:hypothetical protein